MRLRNRPTKSWMEKSKFEIEHEEENIVKKKKILEILRYDFPAGNPTISIVG